MASSMVIKVKYGDTLRRFNATVNGNDQLDLDMAGLKSKVSSLFSLNSESDITLTYIDEDGDVVALIDDDDLRDVMRQQLKFLRINVYLNNPRGGRSNASRSTASSTPLMSPRAPLPVPNMNRAVADVLQSLPEAIQESLMKFSVDLASKATSSSPVLAEIVDAFVKIGLSGPIPDTQSNSGRDASENPKSPPAPAPAPAPASGSKAEGKSQVLPKSIDVPGPSFKTNPEVPKRLSVDLNKLPADCESSEPGIVKTGPSSVCPITDNKKIKKLMDLQKGKSIGCEAPRSFPTPEKHVNQCPPHTYSHPSFNECPFLGLPGLSTQPLTRTPVRLPHPFKRHHGEAMGGGVFHRGIRCDGCGAHPITGPRFKSKLKDDYDLCSICFAEMGTEADYMRIDRPVAFRHPWMFKGPHDQAPWTGPSVLPNVPLGCGSKSGRSKLDSRFVLDVNVIDGTMMPPSASFTKIWRMRNNGGIVWPRGTQLVWIGGDKFSDAVSVEMEIPANGLALEEELDVAVDFTAPGYPGRYISYWRMSSPSGQKFGQRVWVLIQVDASLKNSFPPAPGLHLNLDVSSLEGPKLLERDIPKPVSTEPEKPTNEQQPKNKHEENFPINDSLLIGHGVSAPPAAEVVPPVTYPVIDLTEEPEDAVFFEVAPPAQYVPSPAVNPASSAPPAEGADGDDVREAVLLRELEEMGFKEVGLNKEVLRINEYNLEQSLDHLCGVAEWDPMLDVLDEMGFHDTEVNKKLLEKNNGSVKRSVIDLINGVKP